MPRKLDLSTDWIAARFRDERERLRLTQAQVAKAAGVSRNAAMAWERGAAVPAHALAQLSAVGFDPQYVVTGVRSRNLDLLGAGGAGEEPALSKGEWALLRDYRELSAMQQDQARAMLGVLKVGVTIGGSSVVATDGGIAAGRNVKVSSAPKPKPRT